MTKVKRCSQCGKEVSQGGSFCPFCGNIINETVKSESRESAIDGLDNDIQKKYQNDINKKLQKQKQLEYQKENLLKKKNSLGLKIYNYSKIIQKEIPCCERNKTAPNMPVIKTENSKMDVKWYIAACIAVLEFISGFIPWVSLYYADLFQGQTISCAGIFDLLNDISKFEDWTNSTPEVLGGFVFIIMFGFVMLFINGYFIAQVLQKKESEVSGTIAGISGIVVSVAILLYKWNLDISMEEDNWRWISINTQVGVWLMLLAGIALICVIVFYKSDTEAETKNKPNLEFEVMNYDPVLPIRMKTLKIRKENGKLILELTYAEFEWASIEEFIVDIQLVRYDGTVNTFAQNALFEKKGQNFARFQLQDAGYDLDSIASARVNILGYNIYKSLKKYEEKGSGFSAYSDYSVDELRSARFANSNMVMCMEKISGKTISAAVDRCIPIKIINARFAERKEEVNSMTDTEYRERCRELEENIHMLESEVNVLNNECERLSNLKEKSRNSLQMSSLENNPIFVEKAQVDMEKELPTIGKSQDKKTEDKPEISQGTRAQINQFCPYCGAVVKGMRFCGQCGKRVN